MIASWSTSASPAWIAATEAALTRGTARHGGFAEPEGGAGGIPYVFEEDAAEHVLSTRVTRFRRGGEGRHQIAQLVGGGRVPVVRRLQ
ncbi:hypothetical protein [Streptomyces sp. NPDC001675]